MKSLLPAVLSCLLAAPTFAGSATVFECKMTTECLEQDACASTDLDLAVESNVGNADPFVFITPAETVTGVFMDDNDPNGATFMVARSTGAYHLLNVSAAGKASWSVHLSDADMVITYFGTCEAG